MNFFGYAGMNDYSFLVEDVRTDRIRKKRKGGTPKKIKISTVVINSKELYDESMEILTRILK